MKDPGLSEQYKFDTMSLMHCEILKKEKLKEEVVFIHLKGIIALLRILPLDVKVLHWMCTVQGRKT